MAVDTLLLVGHQLFSSGLVTHVISYLQRLVDVYVQDVVDK